MTRPRLLILSFSTIAADARVLKQVRHFAEHYDVTTCGHGPIPDGRVHHVRLDEAYRHRRWGRADLLLRRFNKIYWEQPAVRHAREMLSHEDRFDAILANDIDTVALAHALRPRGGVHADIHEYAPRQNDEILQWRLLVAPYVRWMCRRHLPLATSMTTVGQGIADEYRRVYGVDAGVVTNATPFANAVPGEVSTPIRLVHSGVARANRRLEILIDAVTATSADVTLDLFLVVNEPSYLESLRDRAGGSPRIVFQDPVPYGELIATLNRYDVGVHVIPPTNFNNRWALPNKFFDYVQARLGLVIGPSPEMRRLLDEHGLGTATDDFTAASLRDVLDRLDASQVAEWKGRSHGAARALSAENLVETWDSAIAALLTHAHEVPPLPRDRDAGA